jgi:hypothetical protein
MTYDPFARFTDEDLASLGVTRDELKTLDPMELANRVKEQADEQWDSEETGIEELVAQAAEGIVRFPGANERQNAFAELYGRSLRDTDGMELDADHMMHLFLFAVFKLAEAREQIAKLSDGNYRKGEG